jgi:Sporulation and spore germination/Immunoglobulin-like domain of bacterial spore germination
MLRARAALAGLAFLTLIAAGCGPSTGNLGAVATAPPSTDPSLAAASPEPTPVRPFGSPAPSPAGSTAPATPAPSTTVRAFFFLGSFTGDSGLVPVLREIPKTQQVGAAAMQALVGGPDEAELSASPAMYTDVPDGTRFLGLTIDNGIATVNLSKEFEAGGDARAVVGRAAQVVYTLTQFPTIQGVQFQIDGVKPKTIFIGSLTRATYTDLLPAIWVDRPAWGGGLGNPGRLTGLANVFEAEFRVQVLSGTGKVLTDEPVTASCGTGCWGTFDVTVHYSVSSAQWGTLRVFDLSAKDGKREHVVDYPVWLTPS